MYPNNLSRPPGKAPLIQRIVNYHLIKKFKLVEATQAFVITNLFFFMGIIVFTLNGSIPPLDFDLTSLDFGFVLILEFWSLIFYEPSLVGALVAGWILASLWAKRNYGGEYAKIILIATQLPVLALMCLTFFLCLLFLPLVGMLVIFIFISTIQASLLIAGISLVLAVAGLVIGNFVGTQEVQKFDLDIDPHFLTLNVIPPTPGEKQVSCPFRMKDRPGCAFLGYEAPADKELICDYKSTWLRCTVYAHIYQTIVEGEE